jgi:hypothetical protein
MQTGEVVTLLPAEPIESATMGAGHLDAFWGSGEALQTTLAMLGDIDAGR